MESLKHLAEIKNLSISLGEKQILKQINFSAAKGEFIALTGPNGSGKTTLLKAIDGLISIQRGEIFLLNQALSHISHMERAKKVAFMMQKSSGGVTFPVLEVVLSGSYPHAGTNPSKEDIQKAKDLLKQYELEGLEDRLFHTLSTGEKQIVLFCRSILQNTPILLLDEPCSNLDLYHQQVIMSAAEELALKGKTIITAIHDINLAARYCHRMIILKEGQIVADGSPSLIMTHSLVNQTWGIPGVVCPDPLYGYPRFEALPFFKEKKKYRIHLVSDKKEIFKTTEILWKHGYILTGTAADSEDSIIKLWEALGVKYAIKDIPLDESYDILLSGTKLDLRNNLDLLTF